jgi:MoxR-like ATPase
MEERQATIDGVRYPLGTHFTVFATQNPVEFEGTYPLPEAQLDRFLLKIRIEYPTAEEERLILKRFETLTDAHLIEQVPVEPLDPAVLTGARAEIAQVRVEPALYQYIVAVIRRTRDWPALSLGASPRAAIGLFFVARALAGMEGRDFLIPDDIKAAAPAVLRHRLMLKPEADLEGLTADSVIAEILAAVEVPK